MCRAWSGLVGMEAELGHSLTSGGKDVLVVAVVAAPVQVVAGA